VKHKVKSISALLLLAAVLSLTAARGYVSHASSEAAATLTGKASASTPKSAVSLPTVVEDMNRTINSNGSGLEAAASLVDLDNDKEYDAGESRYAFKAASTAKVLTAVAYMHEVELGDVSLSQSVGGTSAQQQIKQMIEVSDNTAWANLDDLLGDDLQTYAHTIGMSGFSAGDYSTMRTIDEARLLQQLYQGKLISSAHRALLYDYMSHTNSSNLIQAALPNGATVYHKYGQLEGELHDAAIVSYQGRHFALVIYTKNPDTTSGVYDDQIALIHAVTQAALTDVMKAA
jgi:beta-lactamase class A